MTPMKWFYSFIQPYRKRLFLGFFRAPLLGVRAIINPHATAKVGVDVSWGGQFPKRPVLWAILLLVTAV